MIDSFPANQKVVEEAQINTFCLNSFFFYLGMKMQSSLSKWANVQTVFFCWGKEKINHTDKLAYRTGGTNVG